MEKALTIKEIPDFIISTIQKGSSSYILVGDSFIGKKETVDAVLKSLERMDYQVISEMAPPMGELYRNQTVNSIMDKITGTQENRGKDEVIREYDEFVRNNKKKIAVAIYGMEKLTIESKNILLYMCRASRGRGIVFIGTYSVDEAEDYDRFINFIASEDYINILKVEKPGLDDIMFLTKKMGYKLPENFVKEIARITNFNVDNFRYALRYYRDLGLINDKNEINEVSFRYFPVPPTTEIYYDRMLKSLTATQKTMMQIMAMIGRELKLEDLASLMGISKSSLLEIIKPLEASGMIRFAAGMVRYDSEKLKQLVARSMSESDREYAIEKMMETDFFKTLNEAQRIHILRQGDRIEDIMKIIEASGERIVDLYSSVDEAIEDLEYVFGKIDHSPSRYVLCHAYYRKGDLERALECYEEVGSDSLPIVLDMSSILIARGEYDKADMLLNSMSGRSRDEKEDVAIKYKRSSILYRRGKYDEARDLLNTVLSMSRKLGIKEIEAGALNLLGGIDMAEYRYSDALKKYGDALEINRAIGNYGEIARNLNNISLIDVYTGKYDQAISTLKELIEHTYTTGDLISRLYAIYNLSEIYYVIGHQEYAEGYIPLMLRILDVTGEKRAAYHIHRFLALYYTGLLDFKLARKYAEMAAEEGANDEQSSMGSIFTQIISGLVDGSSKIADEDIEKNVYRDDYASIFYIAVSYHFFLRGDNDRAIRYMEKAEQAAYHMNIPYEIINTAFHRALMFIFTDNMEIFREYFTRMPKPPTNLEYYDECYSIFDNIYRGNKDGLISSRYRIIEEDHLNGSLKAILPMLLNAFALYKFAGRDEDLRHIISVTPEPFVEPLKKLTHYSQTQ
ncbi:tetratricopeptide repeat protein [Thermoplasma sp.]|uniref:tetratricopeptide repeat protein n=1 Tax=Thermoplasma sp. TaxID=1973142 RepID=UPI001285EDF3|nr:tetratricopeptide repeat protein [Thermoplasma sp.]KAA8922457.1 MAG: tetratricopeptide repeat protein [Thermoplasma sp.]